MARELLVLWAGRQKRRPWEELCADYRGRIGRYTTIRDLWIRSKAAGDGPERRQAEARALAAALPEPCRIVAMDPGGRVLTSPAFAEHMGRLEVTWPHPVAFLIGSDLGLDPALIERADERLSLGPMVLGHELARLVLYEQIYRSIAIRHGIKYHRPPL